MKVMFLFQGLPHYYNHVLNRLEGVEALDIINVIPKKLSAGIGAGVYQTRKDIKFKLCELEEYRPIYGSFFFKSLWLLMLKEKPDIIVTTEAHLRGFIHNAAALLTLKCMNIKLILKTHPFQVPKYTNLRKTFKEEFIKTTGRSIFLRSLKYWLKTVLMPLRYLYYRFPDAYTCYLDEAFEIFSSYRVKKDKIFITRNSPDTDMLLNVRARLSQENINTKPHRIIHVGRLVEWKRVELLLAVVAKLKETYPDVELIVVGDGPKMLEWKKMAKLLGIQERVQFTGGVYDPAELGKHLMSSSVYVLAGMGGISINEAMCFGLPVICSNCDGTEKYLVREGINGLFFKENDVDDLYNKIDYLFMNSDLRAKMGLKSTDIIRSDVNINTVINGYIKAFKYATKSD